MKRLPVFGLILGLFLALAAQAAEVRDIYEVEMPVADQQAEARLLAMRAGLAEVLVRVTGYSGAAQLPVLADLLQEAPRYVQQYRYRAAAAAPTPSPNTMAPAASALLWMAFDPVILEQTLRSRGQPVWGRARPLTLAWLAVEDGGQRRLIAAAEPGPERDALEAAARRRGLPLRLPLLDLGDQSQVTAADVWGGFHDTVHAASARYRPQAVLIGRLYRDGQGGWLARWTLRVGEEVMAWDGAGADMAAAIASGVDGSADTLSLRFAQTGGGTGDSVILKVFDVTTLSGYSRVLTYLKSLNGVTDVQLEMAEPQAVTCRLTLEVGAQALVRTIGLGTVLAAISATPGVQSVQLQTELHYRLLP